MMKKILLGIGTLLLMVSCGSPADNVNIADMKSACDCASGFKILANDVLDEIGTKTTDDLRKDRTLLEKLQKKVDKIDMLEHRCARELKITLEAMEACDAGLKELVMRYEERF